jgi:hypothetical protein
LLPPLVMVLLALLLLASLLLVLPQEPRQTLATGERHLFCC